MTNGLRPMPLVLLISLTTEEIPDTQQNATFTILFLHIGAAENGAGQHREETTDSRCCLMKALAPNKDTTQFLPAM